MERAGLDRVLALQRRGSCWEGAAIPAARSASRPRRPGLFTGGVLGSGPSLAEDARAASGLASPALRAPCLTAFLRPWQIGQHEPVPDHAVPLLGHGSRRAEAGP